MRTHHKDLNGVIRQNIISSGTLINTTSGTSHDFTGLPSYVKHITLAFGGVSINAAGVIVVQIGDSGGVEATSYESQLSSLTASAVVTASSVVAFPVASVDAADLLSGTVDLWLVDPATNTWVSRGTLGRLTATLSLEVSAGFKSLSGTLDRVRLFTAAGTATFDAGKIQIHYQ